MNPTATAKRLRKIAHRIAADTIERDTLIVAMHEAGSSTRQIAQYAGITHVMVWRIINKHTK